MVASAAPRRSAMSLLSSPADDEREHLALARRQGFIPGLQLGPLAPGCIELAATRERFRDRREELAPGERLRQEVDRARLHRVRRDRNVAVTADEHDRQVAVAPARARPGDRARSARACERRSRCRRRQRAAPGRGTPAPRRTSRPGNRRPAAGVRPPGASTGRRRSRRRCRCRSPGLPLAVGAEPSAGGRRGSSMRNAVP